MLKLIPIVVLIVAVVCILWALSLGGTAAVIKQDWMLIYRLESYKPIMIYYFKPVADDRVIKEEFVGRQCHEIYWESLVGDRRTSKDNMLIDGKKYPDKDGWTTICLTKAEKDAGIVVDSVGINGAINYPKAGSIEKGVLVDFIPGNFRLVDIKGNERGESAEIDGYNPKALPMPDVVPDPVQYAHCKLRVISGEANPTNSDRVLINGPCDEYGWGARGWVREAPSGTDGFAFVVYINGMHMTVRKLDPAIVAYRGKAGLPAKLPLPSLW